MSSIRTAMVEDPNRKMFEEQAQTHGFQFFKEYLDNVLENAKKQECVLAHYHNTFDLLCIQQRDHRSLEDAWAEERRTEEDSRCTGCSCSRSGRYQVLFRGRYIYPDTRGYFTDWRLGHYR